MDAHRLFGGIRSGIGFLTTIPVGGDADGFDVFIGNVYVFVIAGLLIGVVLGIAGLILQWLMPPALVPVLVVACVFLLTGINHVDGLSDLGDGIIASGTKEKKIAAMKDVHAGAGGILFIGMDLLFLYAAFSLFTGFGGFYLLMSLPVAEVCAKVSMTTVAAFGKSLHPGMGSMLIEKTRKDHYVLGLVIAIIVCIGAMGLLLMQPFLWPRAWVLPIAGFLAVAVSVVLGMFTVDLADNNFGGVNGDVMGAANEMGRIAALLVLGMFIWTLW
jgi:adenosylcobinamide-GDP ribazoletransferase